MNYAEIRAYDVTNGPGVRTTLFVSGCTHNCKGCFNKEQQDFNYGKKWTKEIEDDFIKKSLNDRVVGINILGGEPMQQAYVDINSLLKRLKNEVKKPIWLWTGYTYGQLLMNDTSKDLLEDVDVLIDGKFVEEKRDLMLKYRGSSNQRIIDLRKSEELNKVIELK